MRAAALVLVLSVARTVAAAPTVEIRAQTQLAVDKVHLLREGEAEVTGQLMDRMTGDGIAGQEVFLKIAQHVTQSALTDQDGRFHSVIPVGPGEVDLALTYRGGPLIDGAELAVHTDPSRAEIALTIAVEDVPGGARVTVAAKADDTPIKVPVALAWGQVADKELHPLAKVDSGTPVVLTRKAAGGPGQRHLQATFAGDAAHQAATADATIELVAQTTTTLRAASTRLAYEDDLEVSGTVTDEDGAPLARAAVTLVSGDKRLTNGATAGDGTYHFSVEAKLLGGEAKYGDFGIQVQTDPGRPSVRGSASPPVIVTIRAPQPVPVSYTVAAFVATGLAAGGFFAARGKPWKRFVRRKHRPLAEAIVAPAADLDAIIDGGLVTNKPGVMSTLRRAADDGFAGTVRDTVRGRPVADTVVRLLLGPRAHPTHSGGDTSAQIVDEREVRTGPDGSFAIEKLAAGEWLAEVAAPGHVTEKFAVTIPHRGELRGVRVDLVPVRERVFQLYRRAAEPVLPDARLWGVWSPRQIVDHVRSRRPSPALADLTDFVEEVYFSPRLAAETILPQASEQVDRAIRERAGA